MTCEGLSVPVGKSVNDGQRKSVQGVIHVLQHGATTGTGNAKGALLADEMGTGKTIVSIVAANTLNQSQTAERKIKGGPKRSARAA